MSIKKLSSHAKEQKQSILAIAGSAANQRSGKGRSPISRRVQRFLRKHYMKIFAVIFMALIIYLTVLFILFDKENNTVNLILPWELI